MRIEWEGKQVKTRAAEVQRVGNIVLSERGIEKVIAEGDFGGHITELMIPKEIFVEAYKAYIQSGAREMSGMGLGMAGWVFHNINDPAIDDRTKKEAIKVIVGLDTHNGVKKDDMIDALRYLYNKAYGEGTAQ